MQLIRPPLRFAVNRFGEVRFRRQMPQLLCGQAFVCPGIEQQHRWLTEVSVLKIPSRQFRKWNGMWFLPVPVDKLPENENEPRERPRFCCINLDILV